MNNGLLDGLPRQRNRRLRPSLYHYALLIDVAASGVGGGAVGGGSWFARNLTTIVSDEDGIIVRRGSDAATFVIDPGEYRFYAHVVAMGTNRARCRIQDVTHGRTLARPGLTMHTHTSFLTHVFPLTVDTVEVPDTCSIQLQQIVQSNQGAAWGLGNTCGDGLSEQYNMMEILKVRA